LPKTPSLLQYSISILSPKGIVLPKRHVPWWHDLTEEENASFFRMAKRVSQQIMKVLHPDFVCMYARGRKIPHTHVFLVPTYSGDVLDKFFNALEVFQKSPPALTSLRERKAMEEIAEALRLSLPVTPKN
jgi:histidine triad (HIT) family protein